MQRPRILLIALVVVIVVAAIVFGAGRLLAPRAQNADWTPIIQDFEGVPMVQVPPGCFQMGSATGGRDEQPVHEQCFDTAFWIDRTEVTQGQFAALGGSLGSPRSAFAGVERPVERIDWITARDFCALRGGRLPTEAEWEYAARGPDGLVYPWGNDWNPNNAVWRDNARETTSSAGSIVTGASWVGALDMAGNVQEWTRSPYAPYPHDAANALGSEVDDENAPPVVVRGGDWSAGDPVILRSANRRRETGIMGTWSIGFRCVRDAA